MSLSEDSPDGAGQPGIFAGVRIVELASGIAGPYATRMLADHGAEVIKVEYGSGDPYRADPGFETFNRNKRSVRLDEADVEQLADLLATADVIVTDTPGQAEGLAESAPHAVVVSMPPWGERGPWVNRPATPAMVAAASGISWNQISYTEGPVHLVLPVTAYGAGLLGALTIASGVLSRTATGSAGTYEVSEMAGAGAMQLADFWIDVLPVERDGSCALGSQGRVPVYRLFEASDGEWFFVACGTSVFYERMMTLIGHADLIGNERLPAPPWGLMDLDAISFITPTLETTFATRTRAEWLRLLREADVPCQPVQTREEFLSSDLAASNDLVVSVDHPVHGKLSMTAPPLVLEAAPGEVRTIAPVLGADTEEVLGECAGASTAQPSGGPMRAADVPPLAGVRAVDLSSFIAGPAISRHLAMLGAEVIKVESPSGDAFRAMGAPFNGWNQGKRSIVLNLRTPKGQNAVKKIAAKSDVVIENFRPGVAERLGCGETDLRAVNENVIVLKSPGYGADEALAPVAAFDPLLQALGGVMASQGSDSEPVFLTVPVHDVATPLIAAFGVVAALFHRHRTGITQTVRTSLAHTTTAVQAAEMVHYNGRPPSETGGFDHKGSSDERTFDEVDGEWVWRENGIDTPVERNGFVYAEVAVANGLVVEQSHPQLGVIRQTGQLVGGVGPAPHRAPMLNEHEAEIAAEFNLDLA
ncbi:MAG: CoA transferase [Acidimicrobiales bacterium]|jgi:crotonobetainyl-CoA:carnitine CoA-transferase CaiB-like acyl-CoA transferase